MKNSTLIFVIVILFLSSAIKVNGQQECRNSFSIFSGGLVLKNSNLLMIKLGYEYSNWGYLIDLTYDDYKERWQDGSKSYFRLPAVSLSGRYYLQPLGRSLFAEISMGMGNPNLVTDENEIRKAKSDYLPMCGCYGLGWRFGKKPKGLFGEIAFRSNLSLKDTHLYTTDSKPNTTGLDNISYQSWLFEKGKFNSQIYLGLGYSF